ncbi:MAG: hypothetical protein ACM3X4_00495 [Ignavibacteriales bacterium]
MCRVVVNLTVKRPVTRWTPQRILPVPLVCCLVLILLLPLLPGCGSAGDPVKVQSAESPSAAGQGAWPPSGAATTAIAPMERGAAMDPGTTLLDDPDPVDWVDHLPRRLANGKVRLGPFLTLGRDVEWFWCPGGERLLLTVQRRDSVELWVAGARTGDSSLLYREEDLEAIFPLGWIGPAEVVCLDLSRCRTDDLMAPMCVKVVGFSGDEAECRNLATLNGRLCGACVTPGGRFACVCYMDSPRTAKVMRVDTLTGRRIDLVKDRLAANDFVPPVWFSPDGRSAVMLEFEKHTGPFRLTFLDFVEGRAWSVGPYLELIDWVGWNPSGTHVAHKVADGTHKTVEGLDAMVVVSPKVRILDRTGNVVRSVGLPTGELIESVAWKDDDTLILREMAETRSLPGSNAGVPWVVSLTGAPRPAGPDEAQPFHAESSLPMPCGRSPKYRVEERSWRGSDDEYLKEIIVAPIRRDQNLVD